MHTARNKNGNKRQALYGLRESQLSLLLKKANCLYYKSKSIVIIAQVVVALSTLSKRRMLNNYGTVFYIYLHTDQSVLKHKWEMSYTYHNMETHHSCLTQWFT